MLKPIDPGKARTKYSFPIQAGAAPYQFEVELDKTSTITGVSVYRASDSKPLQSLAACGGPGLNYQVMEDDQNLELLQHVDLNFDGFEDLELLLDYVPHLDKKLYCIYLWNPKSGRFEYSKELSEDLGVNPEAHPESKTITTHEDWQGGSWQDSTYRWNDGKLQLIEQKGLQGDWSQQSDSHCGYAFTCSRLVDDKLTTTLEKPICKPEEMDDLPDCPKDQGPVAGTHAKPKTKTSVNSN